MSATSVAVAKRRFSKQDFYRFSRLVHGWLSAFAFLILCFFSITGILLNHPEWAAESIPAPIETKFRLEEDELQRLFDAKEPELLLPDMAAQRVALRGEFTGGNQARNDLFVRMTGVRGLTDIRANMTTGDVTVIVEPAPSLSVVNELHRGQRAGQPWRWFIDAFAALLVVLSIVGYLIFLSLRFRLRTALIITAASTAGVWALFVFAVF
jgi:hypothetical protein